MDRRSADIETNRDEAVSTKDTSRTSAHKDSFNSRLYGYDIFISFAFGQPPRGTQSYASDLARRLRERDVTVFFSDVPPGEHLKGTLRKALRQSKIVAVIVNDGTLQDPNYVRWEVECFKEDRPKRPIIPINIDGALQKYEQEWLECKEKTWLDETKEAFEGGLPSKQVVEDLVKARSWRRTNVKWRWTVGTVVTFLLALALVAGNNARKANIQRDVAEKEKDIAQTAQVVALGKKLVAEDQTDKARREEQKARDELRRATAMRLIAETPAMMSGTHAGGRCACIIAASSGISPCPRRRDPGWCAEWIITASESAKTDGA